MCGIAGCVRFETSDDMESVVTKMTSLINRRGPDDSGCLVLSSGDVTIGFGHRRLSIIDLSDSGHQPMTYKGLHITFNGEIYNYKEIKVELEKLGYGFESESDTEVILKAFHKWGIEAVQKFIGMFAFGLLDLENLTLYLVRDRAGVKPLYYYFHNNSLLFASELKAFRGNDLFLPEIRHESIVLYLKYGYVPAPLTIFEHTSKVKAGGYVKIDLRKRSLSRLSYWDPISIFNRPKLNISYADAVIQTEELMIDSFKYRMVSDVPVGIFLSGGYDSSIVAAILQKHAGEGVNTFTVGFHEQQFNEAHHAKRIANYLGTIHNETYCSINEAKEIIPVLPQIFDEPFGDSSAVPTTLVSKFASQHVKVVLSADGADEIFAGYNQYPYFLQLYSKFGRIPQKVREASAFLTKYLANFSAIGSQIGYNYHSRVGKLPRLLRAKNVLEFNAVLNEFFTSSELRKLMKSGCCDVINEDLLPSLDLANNDGLNAMLAVSYITSLQDDMLTKVDRATMYSSIEGREPMLDHRLFEFVTQLPSEFKYRNHVSKRILKDIAHKYIPRELIDRPKMGFAIPVDSWLKGDLSYLLNDYLSVEMMKKHNFFDQESFMKVKDDFCSGRQFNFAKVWYLLMFQMWYSEWFNN